MSNFGQLTRTGGLPTWLVSVTGAYLAVKYPLAKHSDDPETFVNCC